MAKITLPNMTLGEPYCPRPTVAYFQEATVQTPPKTRRFAYSMLVAMRLFLTAVSLLAILLRAGMLGFVSSLLMGPELSWRDLTGAEIMTFPIPLALMPAGTGGLYSVRFVTRRHPSR
jgi:hypothetical protein